MKKIILAGVLTAFSAMSANAASILTNGSFEESYDEGAGLVSSHSGGNWLQYSSIPGWTVFGDNAFEIQTTALGIIDAPDGSRYVELDAHGRNPNAGIRQEVQLEVGSYRLTFYYSPRVDETPTNTNDVKFRVRQDDSNILLGTILGAPNDTYPHGKWTKVTASFEVAAAGAYNLDFWAPRLNGGNTLGGFIDDVSLEAVPLPAPALMLLAGVGALGAMRRKKA